MPKVLLSSPVRGFQGKFAGSDVCDFIGKNGLTYARSAEEMANPSHGAAVERPGIFYLRQQSLADADSGAAGWLAGLC